MTYIHLCQVQKYYLPYIIVIVYNITIILFCSSSMFFIIVGDLDSINDFINTEHLRMLSVT